MNSLYDSQWLPSYILPFVTLSYQTTAPVNPDSFHHSAYYRTGLLDGCLVITCIAVMAILRDVARVYIMEPFARWKLVRDWERLNPPSLQNGVVNTNGFAEHGEYPLKSTMSPRDARKIHRSVLRFAEQGWSVIYYTLQWSFGFVRAFMQLR